ncbi:amino acid ABC transporter substrate-binding protein [Govanella unica]|uniref:Amino acid ABC transporter substrate-binding protein n=1 Tax=Govanella unica TaxID=2975056 RepID=A0A9X3Z749_9PROT|nr:amino acid ABC transporter substrate-binding protein [Govania unica]MDA5193875.1 amino acid ABC transporter substrate-binding protein [Govania unica]
MIKSQLLTAYVAFFFVTAAALCFSAQADTLSEIKQRGYLRCGITESGAGFSYINAKGERAGFEIEHCKTLAAAIFGKFKVDYIMATPQTAFTLLQSGGIDVFPSGATWSFLRDASLGLDFAGVYFLDGQGFMVRKKTGVKQVADLDGATICVMQGTTLEQNLADYFDGKSLRYSLITFADTDKALEAYQADRCDAVTMHRSALAARGAGMHDRDQHVILAEVISNEPQGPMVRQGDARWRDIVLWAFNVRVAAEEHGVTQANVEEMRRNSPNREVQRMLGRYGKFGEAIGLSNEWAYDIIRLVGNYEDIWNRNLAPIGLERGPNRLFKDGGLMFALPFR